MKIKETMNLLLALKKGSRLTHVETWKRAGLATSIITSILAATVAFASSMGWIDQQQFPPELITQIATAIVAVVGVFLSYVQTATTEKVGVGKGNVDDDEVIENYYTDDLPLKERDIRREDKDDNLFLENF